MNKTYIYKGMAMLALVAAMASCEEDTLPTNFAPTVTTGGTSDIYRTGVLAVNGTIDNPHGYTVEEYGIEYSSFQSFAEPEKVIATNMDGQGNFSIAIEGLEPGQGYFYRTYVFGGHNTIYGESRNFTTVTTSAPQFGATTTVSNATLTTFDVEATLLDDGGSEAGLLDKMFIYKQVESEEDKELTLSTADGYKVADKVGDTFTATITDLYTGTLYAVRPYASSGSGIGMGAIAYIHTQATNATLLSACTLSDITMNSANIEAHVLAAGTSPIVEVGFCYSRETKEPTVSNYTVQTELDGTTFKTTLTDLYADAQYYVRAYAKSADNSVTYGEVAELTTMGTEETLLSACTLSDSTTNSIHVTAHVLAAGTHPIVETGFCYSSESSEPTLSNLTMKAALEETTFSATLTNLNSGTTYYIRAYAKSNNGSVVYGNTTSYQTIEHSTLEVTTDPATEITTINATLQGYVRDNNVPVSERGFCWSTTESHPTLNNGAEHKTANTNEERFSITIDVEHNTTYYYCAYAYNTKGEVYYGEVQSFTSTGYTLPEVTLGEGEATNESMAIIGGSIVTLNYLFRGEHTITAGIVVSSANTEPTLENKQIVSENDIVFPENLSADKVEAVTPECVIENLSPETTYYYRAYAKNEAGIAYSEVKSFTTKKRTPSSDDAEFPDINE